MSSFSPSDPSPFAASSQFKGLKSPTELLSPTLSMSSPKIGTSKVIDDLHQTIDGLNQQLKEVNAKYNDDKAKHTNMKKKYDQIIDQLANSKHENDMINALLERKQRRISDLEAKLSDSMNNQEDYKFNLNNLEVRCKKLQESEKIATTEFERMKIAYETIVTSQKEYRDYYIKEINLLKNQLSEFINENHQSLIKINEDLTENNDEITTNLSKVNEHSAKLETLYSQKNTSVANSLKQLAIAAKSHGSDTQLIINQCNLVFNELKVKFDLDVNKLIENYKDQHIDNTIEKLLGIDNANNFNSDESESETVNKFPPSPNPNPSIKSNESTTLANKKRSSRKSISNNVSRNPSGGSIKDQENIDPAKPIPNNKKHHRRVSSNANNILPSSPSLGNLASSPSLNKRLSKNNSGKPVVDFGEFEKKSNNSNNNNNNNNKKRNSFYSSNPSSPFPNNQDWKSPKVSNSPNPIGNGVFNNPVSHDLGSDESDLENDSDNNNAAGNNSLNGAEGADKKKKKRRRRRKRKSVVVGLNGDAVSTTAVENISANE